MKRIVLNSVVPEPTVVYAMAAFYRGQDRLLESIPIGKACRWSSWQQHRRVAYTGVDDEAHLLSRSSSFIKLQDDYCGLVIHSMARRVI